MSNNSLLISSNGHPRNGDEIDIMTVRERELLAQTEAAKKQLEMVVNSVSDMFLMLDRDLRYTYVNERMLQASGMAREQIEGRLLTEVFPDAAGTLLETELRRVVEQQVPVKFEYFHESYDRWFENRAYPTPTGLMLLTTEITERKKAADKLQASEERFRALINCMHQQVWINDPEGRAVYINDRWCEYISGQPGNKNINWAEFIHPEDMPTIYMIRGEAIMAGRPYELQYRLRRYDGEYRWHVARAVPHRRKDGSVEYWIGTATDIHDLKTAQEQIKRSEEQFRMLVVTSSQCVWRHSVDQIKQAELQPEADRWWEELTGQTHKQAQGHGWLDVVHPEDRERVKGEFDRSLQEESNYVIEYRVRRLDGEWRWLNVRGILVKEANGKVGEWVGTLADVTERRLAEDALRASESFNRKIIESSTDCIKILDLEGHLLFMNATGQAALEIEDIQTILEKSWVDFWKEEDRPAAEMALAAARAGGMGKFQGCLSTCHGELKWWNVVLTPILDAQGRPERLLGVSRDVTDHKNAEQELRKTQERLDFAQAAGRVGFFDYDIMSGKVVWGETLTELYGIRANEFEGTYEGWKKRVVPEDALAVEALLRRALLERREEIDYEFRAILPNGTKRWLAGRAKYVYDASGAPLRMIGLNLDIHDRKKAEEALRESEELLQSRAKHLEKLVQERTVKLQETIGDLEAFSYSISHDLRAPLRSMQGFAQALQEDCGKIIGPEGNDYIRRIASAASRMDRLIQDVLTFSRVSQVKLDMEVVDVEKLIHGIVETYPNLQLSMAEIAIDGSIPKVMGNESALTQCVSNLLGNAVKFVKPGTKAKVQIRAEQNNDVVRIWFEDNGIGIPKNAQEKIFGIFQKLNKDYEGTGIGLAIVRKAAERMNGRAGVESQVGIGSKFWLELQRGE